MGSDQSRARYPAGAVEEDRVFILTDAQKKLLARAPAGGTAGWYPDPLGATVSGSARFWNGTEWTGRVGRAPDDGQGKPASPAQAGTVPDSRAGKPIRAATSGEGPRIAAAGSARFVDPDVPGWFQTLGSGWSTVLLTGLAATVAQYAAATLNGLVVTGTRSWSTGGLVAVIGGLLMWKLAPSWDGFKRAIWVPILLVTAVSFLLVGPPNQSRATAVDERAPAAQSTPPPERSEAPAARQPTGLYDVVRTTDYICDVGDDYLGCINAHVAVYNSVCTSQPLTSSGKSQCKAMLRFIDDIKARYEDCGYGCETSGRGPWGWPYLRLEPETSGGWS